MTILPLQAATDTPSFWDSVLDVVVAVGWRALGVVAIIVGAFVVAWVLRFIIRRVVRRIVEGAKSRARVTDTAALDASPLAGVRVVQRTRTLGAILQNIVNVAVVIIAVMLCVIVIDRDMLGSFTLLTAAVGAGLGFGAQNIVKDVLNGIFIVAEDQLGIGDVVDLGLASGIVEYVAIRVTHVRDVNGTLWYVRNGEILRIGNMSQGWSRVIVDVAVPQDADLGQAELTVLDAARSIAGEPKWRSRIIQHPEMWGLESVTGDTLVLRVVMKTRATAKDDVAAELRVRILTALEGIGVTVPSLTSVQPEGIAGAQRVRGANPPKTRPTPVAHAGDRPVWKPKPGTKEHPDTDAPSETDEPEWES